LVERGWLPASLSSNSSRNKLNKVHDVIEIEGILRPSHYNPMASNNSLLNKWTSLNLNEVGLACQVINLREFEC